ncbi:MAG: glycosyltransferase family 2 protein [Lachnospiraceae bacterium]|nr:glycosyltransferase family 2 protein [Lachnospiraceae bacterium]
MQNQKELPLISIIIPVYNVEKYLTRCLESVVAQTYSNLEIILVDDGSTDNSGKVCDKYQEIDSRIKVVHKKNGGVSDARNEGIDEACGEYIAFVDSDDWVTRNYIENMYAILVKNSCDIAICDVKRTSKGDLKKSTEKLKTYFKDEAIKQLLYQKISTSACGKLYKVENFIKLVYGMVYVSKSGNLCSVLKIEL